ncbi:FAD-dependent monooxygenase [Nonomuraea sp. NPDC048901]|uniref:FAD-dependent monooxygenase n=1 Tax=unclassified Nonomuraea TaxID=2593643 RepID=UPI0033C57E64
MNADVLIVGGGPVGLLLACELKLAGVDPLVLEAATGQERITRSLGMRSLNARTLHTLGLRGLVEPLAEAQWALFDELRAGREPAEGDIVDGLVYMLREGMSGGHFSGLPLIGEAGNRVPEMLMLKQHQLERVLAEHAAGLGVEVRSGCRVTEIADEGDGVVATLADGRVVRAGYLVGCDGGRSLVRKQSGIPFTGTSATMTGRTAVAELADPGALTSSLRAPGGLVNLSLVPGEVATIEFDGGPTERDAPVTAEEMQASIRRASGTDAVVLSLEAGIRYSDNTRHAETYRQGRILLAGDAAHVHSPIGGQGLNLGLQDAANLGWKLALVVRGQAPERLLDTYTAERHPVAARVLRNTRAQVALMRPGPQVDALREVISEALELPETRGHFIAMANGTDIDYAPDASRSLVGRFVPDWEIEGVGWVRESLGDGRGLLLDLAGAPETRAAAKGRDDRVRVVGGTVDQADAAAVLVRPDGYVAWAGSGEAGLAEALDAWFGVG